MNNYFATVEEKYNPSLARGPFAVCGDPEMRHSIVMAKNSLAKSAGVVTGISYFQAKTICPDLGYVKADFPKYLKETRLAREIYLKYTDTIIPYGMDESWIDLTETGVSLREAAQIADVIRLEIKYSLGLSASVGVSDNYIFSKLGSDFKKPDATTVISRDNYRQTVWPLPASDLLFVGAKRKQTLMSAGIVSIGDIAAASPEKLYKLLGKAGYDIWRFAGGDDSSFKPDITEIGSIGNTITPPEDLFNAGEACAILYLLVNSVCARLKKHRLKAACISVCMRDSRFNKAVRQCTVPYPTNSVNTVFNRAFALFQRHYGWETPLRSLGVRADSLIAHEDEQLSFLDFDDPDICIEIGSSLKALTARFGKLSVEKSATTKDW
jgi:DNA polymerase-4